MEFSKWKLRCSSIHSVVGGTVGLSDSQKEKYDKINAKLIAGKELTKTDKKDLQAIKNKLVDPLPAGLKSFAENEVNSMIYGYSTFSGNKYTDKGNMCEDEAIEVHNKVHFTDYVKFPEQYTENEYICSNGCDIKAGDLIVDNKCPWSLATMPKTKREARKKAIEAGYDWQLTGYNILFGGTKGQISYNWVDTPEELCEWEEPTLHYAGDLDLKFRNITIDFNLEEWRKEHIYERVRLIREYMQKYYNEIINDHD